MGTGSSAISLSGSFDGAFIDLTSCFYSVFESSCNTSADFVSFSIGLSNSSFFYATRFRTSYIYCLANSSFGPLIMSCKRLKSGFGLASSRFNLSIKKPSSNFSRFCAL
jgi:hypothetical protein